MALKIVGRTPSRIRVSEAHTAPMASREIAMQCQACQKRCYAMLPWSPTRLERLAIMREAMAEHRKVCPVGAPEDQRQYTIIYPRA